MVVMSARPDRSVYRSGEVMNIQVVLDYAQPPVSGHFVVRGAGLEWQTSPVLDLQPPLYIEIPVQVPYCTVVEGYTVTGYPITCPSNAVPVSGPVRFVVEFRGPNGEKIAGDSFVVTIQGTATKTPGTTGEAQAPAEEEGGNLLLPLIIGGILLFG